MAESFLSAIATDVLNKIGSLAYQEVSLLCGFKTDVTKLQETITTIQAVLFDAEKKQAKDNRLRLWLGKLKDVLYDAEDVLDEMEFEDLRMQVVKRGGSTKGKVSRFFSSSNPVAFRLKIGHKIKEIRERLDEIARQKSSFGLTESSIEVGHVFRVDRITHSYVDKSAVIGRDGDKERIIHLLMQPSESDTRNVSVIPIVGLGGMGKTTLAKMVYNDKRVDENFELKMWVCVAEEFDLSRLMKEIINSASGDKCAMLSKDELQIRLRRTLDGKKFLLILDDVWNESRERWTELEELLMCGVNGSKIVVSTRSHKVASIMGTSKAYDLHVLSVKDCLSLFVKCAFRDGDEKKYPKLVNIGIEIVKKCGGLPLAVKTLGSLLYSKTEERDWLKIKDNDIWKLEQGENGGIIPALKMSYDHLPSHLKRCFSYCSLFPKDYVFDNLKLVWHWMALGLLTTPNENVELEDVGLRYLKELLSRCFFQDVMEIGGWFEFKMHDLIHDLAALVAEGECSMIKFESENVVDRNVRHFSFIDVEFNGEKVPEFLVNNSKNVRTIVLPILNDQLREKELIAISFVNTCISKFKRLRQLDLRNLLFDVLPDSIATLKHLRYLDLAGNYMLEELPESICKLHCLQTLNLCGCTRLKKLPHNLQNMISLRFLYIPMNAMAIPPYGIRGLSSLRTLFVSLCVDLESLFEGIKSLTALRSLFISNCDSATSLPQSMKCLTRLENLTFRFCKNINMKMELQGEDLCFSLQTFIIVASSELVDLPQLILQGSAKTLRCMTISDCHELVALPEWLQNLTSLEKLKISGCRGLSSLPEGMECLTALRELRIEDSPALVERCKQDMSKLAHIPEIHLNKEIFHHGMLIN